MLELDLPYPPSVNHYWRQVGARTLISRGGRAFRQSVCSILAAHGVRPLDGPLEVAVDLFPPDRRRRDLDNALKSLLDALAHGGAYHDDSQTARLTVERRDVVPQGRTRVAIDQYREAPDREAGHMTRKPRTCLKCDRTFDSDGPGHRICPRCAKTNARVAITAKQLQKQRGRKLRNGEVLSDPADDGEKAC